MTHYELAEKTGAKITSTTDDNGTGLWATFHTFEFSDIGLLHLISLVEEATKEKAAQVPVARLDITYGREPECYTTEVVEQLPEGIYKLYLEQPVSFYEAKND